VVIAVVVVIVAAGLGFGIFKKMTAKPVKHGPTPIVIGETVLLDEFLINLADTDSSHYLKTTIGLGLIQGKTGDDFKNKIPGARDAIVMVLSAKKLSDVSSTSGKEQLKKDLLTAINQADGDKNVGAIYFEAFATQ
jgi:flagellar FliL protein